MTVRLWKATKEGVIPDSQRHALFGHKGQINCLQGTASLMLSGSSDKSIIVWEGYTLRSQKTFESSV
jgi:WD40 repeat protein